MKTKVMVLDSYDSFTYNLVAMIRQLGYETDVYKNDRVDLEQVEQYDKILLSPGPGIPDQAGCMKDIIQRFGPRKSILGVCLGHQGIAEVFGAKLYNMHNVLHGITSRAIVIAPGDKLFRGLPARFSVTHYHSWAVVPSSLPAELAVTVTNDQGMVLGIAHRHCDVRGVQFHPESFRTEHGTEMIQNWLSD